MTIPSTTLAWLAALIDGEGSIMLIDRKTQRARQFRAVVSIANTDSRLSDELTRKTGISRVYVHRRAGPRNRQQYTWRMNGEDIKKWLPLVLPWLVLKREQATLLLEYLKMADTMRCRAGEPRVTNPEYLQRKLDIHARIKFLNRRYE